MKSGLDTHIQITALSPKYLIGAAHFHIILYESERLRFWVFSLVEWLTYEQVYMAALDVGDFQLAGVSSSFLYRNMHTVLKIMVLSSLYVVWFVVRDVVDLLIRKFRIDTDTLVIYYLTEYVSYAER